MQPAGYGPKSIPVESRPVVPVRSYLPTATSEAILARHTQGEWAEELPGERQMCLQLQVSRGTLRQALHILQKKGMIETRPGCGHRILAAAPGPVKRPKQKTIRFLSPEPLETRRAFFSLMLDKLHETADARGWMIRREHGRGYFGSKFASRLDQLVAGSERHCWILVHANRKVQEWFRWRNLPAIVSGHTHSGVNLPSLDVDHCAAGRHAAGVCLRRGHRSMAMVVSSNPLPGLREGERGFVEAFAPDAGAGRQIIRLVHRGVDSDLVRIIRKLFSERQHPTGVLVETPNQYITVLSTLAQMHLVVPDDVSLISRLDDPFMQHFVPEPARYQLNPVLFSRTLATMITHILEGETLNPRVREIMPEFIAGKSVSAPAQPVL